MAKYLRYKGEFYSVTGKLWRVEILQQAESAFPQVGILRFPASEALSIEYEATSKENVMQSSIATLVIESPGDRTYQDLYTIENGNIHLHVYCENRIYWSGTLDPEFYEEPYSRGSLYDVSLTFSDFGILKRRKYALKGRQKLRSLINEALTQSGIYYASVDDSKITTLLPASPSQHILDSIAVKSENWYDEEGEVNSYYEVLEAILTPLNIRMQQRCGVIHLYDLNGLYNSEASREIFWSSDDQKLGTDKVANNVKVAFSPYAQSKLANDELVYQGEWNDTSINETGQKPSSGPEFYSYYEDESVVGGNSFSIFIDDAAEGSVSIGEGCKFFKIVPLHEAEETTGIAVGFSAGRSVLKKEWKLNRPHSNMGQTGPSYIKPILITHRIPIQHLDESDRAGYRLRLMMDMLLDCRYNPYTDANEYNYETNQNAWKIHTGMVYLEASIYLYNEEGDRVAKYDNSDSIKASYPHFDRTFGSWKGADENATAYLAWYHKDDRAENSGVLGWNRNKHAIPLKYASRLPSIITKNDDAQYMTYPNQGGYIEIIIYNNLRIYDYTQDLSAESNWDSLNNKMYEQKLLEKINWFLVKLPTLEIVKNNTVFGSATSEDLEYSGLLNKYAKENIEIETIVGTSEKLLPAARGCYVTADVGSQVKILERGARTEPAEELLIGTLYSQFADRKTKLTGTARLEIGGVTTYTDAHQGEKKFILLGEVQSVQMEESEIVAVELRPDEYEKTN